MDDNRSIGSFPIKQGPGFGPLVCGALLASYIMFGAFGAHALDDRITPDQLNVYQTATHYHELFALLSIIVFLGRKPLAQYVNYKAFCWGLRLSAIGFSLFCGSLYLLSTRQITGFGQAYILGPITPLGGMLMIVGIALVFTSIYRSHHAQQPRGV